MPVIYLTNDELTILREREAPGGVLAPALEAFNEDDWAPFADANEAGRAITEAALDYSWWRWVDFGPSTATVKAENPYGEGVVKKMVSLAHVAGAHAKHVTYGIPVPAEGKGYGHMDTGGDDLASYDADSADVALQIAVFGEVIYG